MKKPNHWARKDEDWERLLWVDPDLDWAEYFRVAWSGPMVDPGSDLYAELTQLVRRLFTAQNVIRECTYRWLNGVLGRDPAIESDPGIQQTLLTLSRQWQQSGLHSEGLDPILQAAKSWYVCGRAYLRLYENPSTGRIGLHCAPNNSISVERDGYGEINRIVYHYSLIDDRAAAVPMREIQFIDPQGVTQFEIYEGEGIDPIDAFSLDLGGRYSVAVMIREAAVTQPVRSLQRALNSELTIMGQNSKYAGFLREVLVNSQPPGNWQTDAAGNLSYEPSGEPLRSGPGETLFVTGLPRYDSGGNLIGYESPGVHYREPVSPDGFLRAIDGYRKAILQEFQQTHVEAVDTVQSGQSRIQARSDYLDLLEGDCTKLSHYLEYVYSVAAMLSGASAAEADSITVSCYPDPGAPTTEEISQVRENYKIGLIDHRTALIQMGIEDPDTILESLQSEQQSIIVDPENPTLLPQNTEA